MGLPSLTERLNTLEIQAQKLSASYDKQDEELNKIGNLNTNVTKLKNDLADEKKELENLSRNRTLKEFCSCFFKHLKNMWNGVPTPENERVWSQFSLLRCAIVVVAVVILINIITDQFFPMRTIKPSISWQKV